MSRLQIGCFDCAVPGWHNTDITPHIWIARFPLAARLLRAARAMTRERFEQHQRGVFKTVHYLNVCKPFPYADSTFEAVFSAHLLEHLFQDDAAKCLSEIHRVLKPGGVCRIVVPDLDLIVSRYDPANPDKFLKMVFEESDRRSIKNVHHWHYNARSLVRILKKIGFMEARRCSYREGQCPDIELLDNRPDESLYIEGIK